MPNLGVSLTACMLLASKNPTDLMASSVFKQCAANYKALEGLEIHKSPTIIVTVVKIVFLHHTSEQSAIKYSEHPPRYKCHPC